MPTFLSVWLTPLTGRRRSTRSGKQSSKPTCPKATLTILYFVIFPKRALLLFVNFCHCSALKFDEQIFWPPVYGKVKGAFGVLSVMPVPVTPVRCCKRCKIGLFRSGVGMWRRHFDWYQFRPPRSTLTPQTDGLIMVEHNLAFELRPNDSRWGTLWIYRCCEVIVVANAAKIFNGFAIKFAG